MNVTPGDVARVVHPDLYGRLVIVHQLIASSTHRLPDGWLVSPDCVGCWEIESLGSAFPILRGTPSRYTQAQSHWAACDDKWLRPIKGEEGDDETLDWAGKPSQVDSLVEAR
jgi:hypothetical protein